VTRRSTERASTLFTVRTMASAFITARTTARNERRFVVRYRCGGRGFPIVHAGSFPTLKEARARRDLVAGELAAGRNPADTLRALVEPRQRRTLAAEFDRFIASRVDVGASTIALYGNARDRLRSLADRSPEEITAADVQAWIAENNTASGDYRALAPKSLGHYLSSLRQVLDYADVIPNPARSPKVRLPELVQEEITAPAFTEWEAIKANLPKRSSLAVRVIECEGLRISEAVTLTYGDVDFAGGRVRISKARTKGRTAGQRWLPVPGELLDEIADLVPLEDRHKDRRVFPQLTDRSVRSDLGRACRDAGVVAYPPHSLRHRRCSLWYADLRDAVAIKVWSGHSRASLLTDLYSHVLLDHRDEWQAFWRTSYAAERSGGVVPVWSREGETSPDPAP
jgi:integrase